MGSRVQGWHHGECNKEWMVRAAELGSRAGKRTKHWRKVGAGPKKDQALSASSREVLTARPGFLPTSSVLCSTPCLYKLFLYRFGYDFLIMTMSAFKDCASYIWIIPLVWESNTSYLWQSRKIKCCLVNKQAQTSLPQHTELKYFTQLLNGT